MAPDKTFRELAEAAWPVPGSFMDLRYGSLYLGVGLCDEYPWILDFDLFDAYGTDRALEPGRSFCVANFIGEVGGHEGGKIEQQAMVTETSIARVLTYHFYASLLGHGT